MPTKTDRILSYLPGTFLALPRPTALYSVADAFGNELLQAENTLVAVMRSHWVDYADQGDEIIDDLARIASLYGLGPRDDETVEDFRAHLKRYVRTFLEGTPTVQGILRLTAEALALLIADSYEQMDAWWTRPEDALVTVEPQGDDAGDLLFTPTTLTARGSAGQRARIAGAADLSGGLDLRAASSLVLKIDAAAPVVLDLGSLLAHPGAATLADIVAAINSKLAPQAAAASTDGQRLVLSSSSTGPTSRIEVQDIAGDAAPALLGLRPRMYAGSTAVSAQVVGAIDLAGGVDLSDRRYLRLLIDGTHLAEIDCAGPTPATTKLNEIVASINAALGLTVAAHDGRFLSLTSPTQGFSSVLQFQSPAGQDATQTLFGPVNGIYTGTSAQPAAVTGTQDLSRGIDLSRKFNIEFALDGGAHILVNCTGANPAAAGGGDIVTAINKAAGLEVASQNGQFVTLRSPTQGPGSSIQFFTPAAADATFEIFGLAPRQATGQAASAARLTGPDIASGTLDLAARHLLQIAVDGGPPAIVDFWKGKANLRAVTLDDVASSINSALGAAVASRDGQHLALTSIVAGASSSLAVLPLERIIRRRFVTRAFVTDEASQITLGVFQQKAVGAAASPARVEGTAELSRGVDLRDNPFLQLSIDGGAAMLIDCSVGVPRPRLALPEEIVKAINTQIGPGGNSPVASTDGHHLFFTSRTTGAASSIELQQVLGSDAAGALGLQPAIVFGRDASRVVFVSTVDLSGGLDLSTASKVKLAIDGAAPVEIDCAGPDPAHTTLGQIVTRINTPLHASIAIPVGKTIVLTSPGMGASSKIEFLVPGSHDATQMIFGVGARAYHGDPARAPQVTGSEIKAAAAGVDLRQARFLRVGWDGGPLQVIDCSAGAADAAKVKLPEIIAAINKAARQVIASSPDGKRLTLTGPTAAASGKLALDTFTSTGAFALLMGTAAQVTRGTDPAPATIVGTVDLLAGVNLDERRILRLAVDGGRPLDIDISGAKPEKTFLDEIVAKVNAVAPGVASANAEDRLVLASPTRGEESRLEVLPIRVLEVVEYTPVEAEKDLSLKPGDKFSVNNSGAADSELTIEISTPQGVAGAEFVNRSTGARIRVLDAVPAGGLLRLWNDAAASGLRAVIVSAEGQKSYVPAANILAGPLGSQGAVPYSGARRLCGGAADLSATLQLNNPQAPSITVVRARRRGLQGSKITVAVTAAALPPLPAVTAEGIRARLEGRLRFNSGAYTLVDSNNVVLASLRTGTGAGAFGPEVDQVVLVQGNLFPGEGTAPVMVVDGVAALFDVTIQGTADDGSAVVENYAGVSIGAGISDPRSLVLQVLSKPSRLVIAEELAKSGALQLPRGRSEWSYLAASGARFNQATFNHAHFAGGPCLEQGIFNVSRFSDMPPELEAAVFAGLVTDPPVQVKFRWRNYRPGAFAVNLPADLPEKFGARFGQARFARPGDAPEVFSSVVTEPQNDEDYLVRRINETSSANPKSTLVQAARVERVPLGWDPMPMPFHHPRARSLSGGTDTEQAAIYLAEPGVPGFIELKALAAGKWGNTIKVTARKASPGRFDVTIGYQAARFENARQTVFAGRILPPGEDPLPALTDEVLKPRPVGVVQGKAAGVLAQVTRDGTQAQE
jgi:hypothetical protein